MMDKKDFSKLNDLVNELKILSSYDSVNVGIDDVIKTLRAIFNEVDSLLNRYSASRM